MANRSLSQIISDLGLTSGLKLCLDAGDSASYDPGVQTVRWLDTSGNGYDFFRGATGSSEASDPTFNGSAGGLSSGEYWSFDGGDYFTYDTTNETWMNNLHKDGSTFTIIAITYKPSLGSLVRIFSTGSTATAAGCRILTSATDIFNFIIANGTASQTVFQSSNTIPVGWSVLAFSYNEATGAFIYQCNGAEQTGSVTFSSPTTSNASMAARIGVQYGTVSPSSNGIRNACIGFWEGTALSSAQLTDLYDAIKERYFRSLLASAGDFYLDGKSATLTYTPSASAYELTAQAGSFSLAGKSATLLKSKSINASAGAFSLAGSDATLARGRVLLGSPGAFSLDGVNVSISKSRVIDANAGSFILGGNPVTITYSGSQIPEEQLNIASVLVFSKLGAK